MKCKPIREKNCDYKETVLGSHLCGSRSPLFFLVLFRVLCGSMPQSVSAVKYLLDWQKDLRSDSQNPCKVLHGTVSVIPSLLLWAGSHSRKTWKVTGLLVGHLQQWSTGDSVSNKVEDYLLTSKCMLLYECLHTWTHRDTHMWVCVCKCVRERDRGWD